MGEQFQNLSIRSKLRLLALTIVGLTAAFGVYGFLLLHGNAAKTAALQAGVLQHADTVAKFQDRTADSIADLYRLTSVAGNESDTAKIEALAKTVTDHFNTLQTALANVKDAMMAEGFTDSDIKGFETVLTAYIKRGKDVADMASSDVATATGMMTGTRQRYEAMDTALGKIVTTMAQKKQDTLSAIESDMSSGEMVFAGSLTVIILTALALSFFIGRAISNPLVAITEVLGSLAKGDLTIRVENEDRSDEVGQLAHATVALRDQLIAAENAKIDQVQIIVSSVGAGLSALANGDLTYRITTELTGHFAKLKDDFNAAMARLEDTMQRVLANTKQITSGAGDISQATDDLSRRTEQQAATLEQTAAALEEITNSVKAIAKNLHAANDSATAAKAAAEDGGTVVGTAIEVMSQIEQSSKQIADIIGVIDEIAFQTNLLALNAGVEAARAGDAGRGFAVVASEVRALAGRSSDAAKKIKNLIATSGGHVAEGVKIVGHTSEALHRIVEQILHINAIVSEVAQASEQQSSSISEVNAAVGQMDQVTQQNAAMVEESTAAARSLAHETGELKELVAFFAVEEARSEPKLRVVARR